MVYNDSYSGWSITSNDIRDITTGDIRDWKDEYITAGENYRMQMPTTLCLSCGEDVYDHMMVIHSEDCSGIDYGFVVAPSVKATALAFSFERKGWKLKASWNPPIETLIGEGLVARGVTEHSWWQDVYSQAPQRQGGFVPQTTYPQQRFIGGFVTQTVSSTSINSGGITASQILSTT